MWYLSNSGRRTGRPIRHYETVPASNAFDDSGTDAVEQADQPATEPVYDANATHGAHEERVAAAATLVVQRSAELNRRLRGQ